MGWTIAPAMARHQRSADMQIDTTKIQASVYTENRDKKILYVKVYIPSLEMYINSCTVRPSPQFGDLWFQMPAFLMGNKWVKPIEFGGASEFLDLIKDEAMRAADHYIQDKNLQDIFPGAKPVDQDEVHDVGF
jgi:hypothetical protein